MTPEVVPGQAWIAPAGTPPTDVAAFTPVGYLADLAAVEAADAELQRVSPPSDLDEHRARAAELARTSPLSHAAALRTITRVVQMTAAFEKVTVELTLNAFSPEALGLWYGRRTVRRARRLRTHVWETPARSRMHAAYRAKTRRRNRR